MAAQEVTRVKNPAIRKRLVNIAAASVAMSLVLGCSPAVPEATRRTNPVSTAPSTTVGSQAASTSTAPLDVRSVDLDSITYRLRCRAGSGQDVEVAPSAGPTATPGGDAVADPLEPVFADVTGDGREDALVEVRCTIGGDRNSMVSSVVLIGGKGGHGQQVGPAVEGSAPVVVGASVVVTRKLRLEGDSRPRFDLQYVPLAFAGHELAERLDARPVTTTDVATPDGIGGFKVGRTYAEVAATLGQPLMVRDVAETGDCRDVWVEGGLVGGLGDLERLHSVEIGNIGIKTEEGLGIGSTEKDVYRAFSGQVVSTSHEYVEGGHYLAYTVDGPTRRQIVYDTNGTNVEYYRVGDYGWAAAIEGCL